MKEPNKQEILQGNGTYNIRHGTVKSPLFSVGGFYDPMDTVQVKYEMLRDGQGGDRAVKDVANDFGFSRTAYYTIKEDFDKQGMEALFPKKTGPKQPHKLTPELREFVDGHLARNPKARVIEIADAIYEDKGVKISRRTIERYIVKKTAP